VLFGIIALGHFLRTPKEDAAVSAPLAKETAIFDLSKDTAYVTVPAKVKKERVVSIVALSGGVVTDILTSRGRTVEAGQTLLTLTNDYQSGATALEKSLANETTRLALELADIDKDIYALEQKRIRRDDSLSGTEEDIELERLKKDRATRRSTLTQSTLSQRLSSLSDASLRPKSYTTGTIESIRVNRGDLVSPGQVLVTLSATKGATTLEAVLDPKMARLFDATKEAKIEIAGETIALRPTFFSGSENENGLFSVMFTLSEGIEQKIVDGEFLKIELPFEKSADTVALIPIDTLFQDDETSSVLVEKDGVAVSLPVEVGNLYGSFAEIRSGIGEDDRIIMSRAVLAGDSVTLK